MATQVIHSRHRARLTPVLIALGIAVAILVLATQAASIWSTRSSVQPDRLIVPSTTVGLVNSGTFRPAADRNTDVPSSPPSFGGENRAGQGRTPGRGSTTDRR